MREATAHEALPRIVAATAREAVRRTPLLLGVSAIFFCLPCAAIAQPAQIAAIVAPAPVTPNQPAAPVTAPTPASQPPSETESPAPAPPATPKPATGRRLAAFSISADQVNFYSNRFIVEADGHVRVVLGDGTKITGNTFSMDLRLNRFLIAGDVKLTAGGRETDGAAFAEFFDFDRAYFVPITSEPDRWTFAEGDYAHPLLGREMPGDVFELPNLAGERNFLFAKRAVIDPNQSVRFTPASLNFGVSFVRFPSYFLDFSKNPNFAQNALSGADIDVPLDFAGGEHGLATLHLRYDSINHVYLAYEQHQISDNHYLVFSANPLTQPGKQYNFIGYDRISPVMQVQLTAQEFAFQHSFTQPLSASAFVSLQITEALPHSFLQLTTQSYYQSLLGQPQGIGRDLYYGDPSHLWIPDHPAGATLQWTGFRHHLKHIPIAFQLRSSFGVNHNGISTLNQNSGLISLGGVDYDTEWNHGAGITLLSDPIVLLHDRANRGRDTYLTAVFDKQRTYFSIPHHIDYTTTTVSLTKVIDRQHLTALASYTNANIADFYGAQQSLVYPASVAVSPATGEVYPQYLAFRGLSTSRSFRQQLVFTPSTAVNASISMRENDDFPIAVPGISTTVGNVTYFNNYGIPPYQFTADVRFRLNSLLVLDVSRSYFFNFGGFQRWSPAFTIQFVK
jgi:hypothetical protein